MLTENIVVANLKCDGCATTIRHKLMEFEGVQSVLVFEDKDLITIVHDGKTPHEKFTQKLLSLGYPEATEENGLLTQLKSYASCVVGRLTKD